MTSTLTPKPWIVLLAGVAALGVTILYAQQNDTGAVFHSDARLVICQATIVDRSGPIVDHLTKDAFSVFENNIRQEMRIFKH